MSILQLQISISFHLQISVIQNTIIHTQEIITAAITAPAAATALLALLKSQAAVETKHPPFSAVQYWRRGVMMGWAYSELKIQVWTVFFIWVSAFASKPTTHHLFLLQDSTKRDGGYVHSWLIDGSMRQGVNPSAQ